MLISTHTHRHFYNTNIQLFDLFLLPSNWRFFCTVLWSETQRVKKCPTGSAVWHRERSNLFAVVVCMNFAAMPHNVATITEIRIGLIVHLILSISLSISLCIFHFNSYFSVYCDCWFDLNHSKKVLVQKIDRTSEKKKPVYSTIVPFFFWQKIPCEFRSCSDSWMLLLRNARSWIKVIVSHGKNHVISII